MNSDLAKLIQKTDVGTDIIIWDEAVMAHKHIFMAVDRTLRDIMSQIDPSLRKLPSGGIKVIFGGDFRQILPVVKRGKRSSIVNASLKHAEFWKDAQTFRLFENMRIEAAAINQGIKY